MMTIKKSLTLCFLACRERGKGNNSINWLWSYGIGKGYNKFITWKSLIVCSSTRGQVKVSNKRCISLGLEHLDK
jgi:hypothetical protein